jgi:hypothetical protein
MKWFLYFLSFGLGTLILVFPIIAFFYGDREELYKVDIDNLPPIIGFPILGLAFIYAGYNIYKSQK